MILVPLIVTLSPADATRPSPVPSRLWLPLVKVI